MRNSTKVQASQSSQATELTPTSLEYSLAQPVLEKYFVLQEIQIFLFKLVTESSAREHRKFINFQFPWNCFFLSRTNSELSNPSQGEVSFYIARDVRARVDLCKQLNFAATTETTRVWVLRNVTARQCKISLDKLVRCLRSRNLNGI